MLCNIHIFQPDSYFPALQLHWMLYLHCEFIFRVSPKLQLLILSTAPTKLFTLRTSSVTEDHETYLLCPTQKTGICEKHSANPVEHCTHVSDYPALYLFTQQQTFIEHLLYMVLGSWREEMNEMPSCPQGRSMLSWLRAQTVESETPGSVPYSGIHLCPEFFVFNCKMMKISIFTSKHSRKVYTR